MRDTPLVSSKTDESPTGDSDTDFEDIETECSDDEKATLTSPCTTVASDQIRSQEGSHSGSALDEDFDTYVAGLKMSPEERAMERFWYKECKS
jgi:hypothetical protein